MLRIGKCMCVDQVPLQAWCKPPTCTTDITSEQKQWIFKASLWNSSTPACTASV